MDISPYLNFKGECAEAFEFYAKILGGQITFMQTHGDSPMKDSVPPEWQDKIMHATLKVGDKLVMGSDAPPAHYSAPAGFFVSIALPSAEEGARIFNALTEGGAVH